MIRRTRTEIQNNYATDLKKQGLTFPKVNNPIKETYEFDEKTEIVQLIDYAHKDRNVFHIANQWRVEGHDAIRCDMVVFVNGLPLVVIELKSPSEEGVTVHDAYLQMRNYQLKVPDLFTYNAFNVISDMEVYHGKRKKFSRRQETAQEGLYVLC